MSSRAIVFSLGCIACLTFISVARSEELLLTCSFRSLSDRSAPEIEVAARIDTDSRTATWGHGNKAESVTITEDGIKIELPPWDTSVPTVCSEKLYVRQSISIDRINGHVVVSQITDLPSPPCHREYAKAGIEWDKSNVLMGKCAKATKRAF